MRHLVNHISFSYRVDSVRIWPRPFKKSDGSVVKQLWFLGLNMNGPVSQELVEEPVFPFLDRGQDDAARMSRVSPKASSFKVDFEFLSPNQLGKFLPKNIIFGFSDPPGYRSPLNHGRVAGCPSKKPPFEANNNNYQVKAVERKFPKFKETHGVLVWPGSSS